MTNNIDFENRVARSLDFIEGCDLGECDHTSHAVMRAAAFDVDEKNPTAQVIGNTIVSVVAGMSVSNKKIINDILLFATLASNKAAPQGGNAWYQKYMQVLTSCGLYSQSSGWSDYSFSNKRFTMDQVALEILQSAILAAALPGATAVLMLKVAKDTITALQRNDAPLRLFERESKTHDGAKFAIAAVAESADGAVAMAMGSVDFKASQSVTDVLFWEWSNTTVRIQRGENVLTLNHDQYEHVRKAVEAKLGASAMKNIEEIEI